ncbi:MAG: hypothetical protein HPY71_13165 [Firmicutes bacterium]|nr:hypothetical protein [Bacillota bacterium]
MFRWVLLIAVFLAGIGLRLITAMGLWQFRHSGSYASAHHPKKVSVTLSRRPISPVQGTKKKDIMNVPRRHDRNSQIGY